MPPEVFSANDGMRRIGVDGADDTAAAEPLTGTGPTVALIGCGPAGMFFLHALATKRRDLERKLLQRDDDAARAAARDKLASLPLVTCYEKSDRPGGIWRSSPSSSLGGHGKEEEEANGRTDPPDTRMYGALWTNSPKELIEFPDYTFEEHFGGKEVPAFLPRADVLDYIMDRTTSVDRGLYDCVGGRYRRQHNILFDTAVQSVTYDQATRKFVVLSSASGGGGETKADVYDYCIWAGGRHGKPRIPRALLSILRTGGTHSDESDSEDDDDSSDDASAEAPSPPSRKGCAPFKGTVLHSCHMSGFEQAVRGKRIVLIGDAGSAEDLALRSVQLGVKMCYILSRSGYGDCVYMGSWPGIKDPSTGKVEPKVKAHIALPYRTVNDGTGFKCNEMIWNDEADAYEIDETVPPVTLTDIQTLIFCTGYVPSQECLSPELRFLTSEGYDDEDELFWEAPKNFQMKPNPFTPEVGDVTPSDELDLSGTVVQGVYRTVNIANPKMMYLLDVNAEYPLLELDVAAWLSLAFITAEATVPPKDVMEKALYEQMMEEMHIPYLRWCMDMNYFEALNDLDDHHWSDNLEDERSIEMETQYARYFAGILARDMRMAKYPADFGTYNDLTEEGEKHVQLALQNLYARHLLDPESPDAEWKTFRDADPTPFKSIYTGQGSCALPGRWLDLDKSKKLTSLFVEGKLAGSP